jgi:NitT/TauT family transport system substrate-binding protein
MLRPAFLRSLGSAAALSAAPSLGSAQSPVRIRAASAPDIDLVAALWGIETGAFAKAGLDFSMDRANSGAAVAAAVAGGSLEMGKSSLVSLFSARSRGLPFVLVAACAVFNVNRPDSGMLVAKDAPMRRPRDLNGKTLSCQSLNDMNQMAMAAWVDQDGGDSKTLKFLELPVSAAPAAIASGRIDGANLSMMYVNQAVAAGQGRFFGPTFTSIAPRFIYAGFFATADYAAKNKTALDAFRRVMAQTGAFANAHHDQTAAVVSKFTGLETTAIDKVPVEVATRIDPKLIQPLVDRAIKYKLVAPDFDLHAMIDPDALA